MELINVEVEKYVTRFTSKPSKLEQEVLDETIAQHLHAHMISGNVQGKLLAFISGLFQPKRILEIGTFTGYSALSLVNGMAPDGQLHTIEIREEDAETARGYFSKSPQAQQIHLHVGNAKEIIPTLKETWDLVFIDADKVSYIDYYELTLPLLKTGGIIIADNVLFHGQVLSESITGKNAIAIHAFNQHVAADPRVEQVMLTVRDGIMLIKKL